LRTRLATGVPLSGKAPFIWERCPPVRRTPAGVEVSEPGVDIRGVDLQPRASKELRMFRGPAAGYLLRMPPDPDERPTEHLPPTRPVAREAVAREHVVAEAVDPLWAERLEGSVRSLKRLVALLAVLALAGVGLSVYALLRDDDDRRGASRERVARLDNRVDRLESRLGSTTNEADVARLRDRLETKADTRSLQQLSDDVQQLQTSLDKVSSGDDSSADAVTQLDGRVDELSEQLEALRNEQAP